MILCCEKEALPGHASCRDHYQEGQHTLETFKRTVEIALGHRAPGDVSDLRNEDTT